MALKSHEEPAAAERFLDGLTKDEKLRRRYIDAGHEEVAVAALIAEHTGMDVEVPNLPGIARHLYEKYPQRCADLAKGYPAMNFIIAQER